MMNPQVSTPPPASGTLESVKGFLDEHTVMITDYGVRVIGVLVLLIFAWICASWARRVTRRALQKAKFDATLTGFFGNMAKWAVLGLAVLACLSIFGINTTSFAAVIAALGLAVGLALQGTLGNFASGIMLLVFRPFTVGQTIEAGGVRGKVYEIDLFTTKIDTPDNRRLIVPNGDIFGSKIENVSHHPKRRVDVEVGVEYAAAIDVTRETLTNAARSVEKIHSEPDVVVVLTGLGASSVDWAVRVWADTGDYAAVKEALLRAVKVHLDEAKIGIPFPQMDVHLDHPVGS